MRDPERAEFPDRRLLNLRLSAVTTQKVLTDNGLGTRIDRWLALETATPAR